MEDDKQPPSQEQVADDDPADQRRPLGILISDDEADNMPSPTNEDESLISSQSDTEVPDSESDQSEPNSPVASPTVPEDGPEDFNIESDDDISTDEEMEDEDYLQKFDQGVRTQFLAAFHPEAQAHNFEEVLALAKVTRSPDGRIIDALHRTIPFLTKYERTRVVGQRAAQLDTGAQPFVSVPTGIVRGSLIAEMELRAKKLPFIIRRPLPNRGSEYWRVSDLELL